MKIKDNIAVSDSGFVFNPATGDSFNLNNTGLEILRLIREGKNPEEITATVCEHYDTDEFTFGRYLEEFTAMLRHYGLLASKDEQ